MDKARQRWSRGWTRDTLDRWNYFINTYFAPVFEDLHRRVDGLSGYSDAQTDVIEATLFDAREAILVNLRKTPGLTALHKNLSSDQYFGLLVYSFIYGWLGHNWLIFGDQADQSTALRRFDAKAAEQAEREVGLRTLSKAFSAIFPETESHLPATVASLRQGSSLQDTKAWFRTYYDKFCNVCKVPQEDRTDLAASTFVGLAMLSNQERTEALIRNYVS